MEMPEEWQALRDRDGGLTQTPLRLTTVYRRLPADRVRSARDTEEQPVSRTADGIAGYVSVVSHTFSTQQDGSTRCSYGANEGKWQKLDRVRDAHQDHQRKNLVSGLCMNDPSGYFANETRLIVSSCSGDLASERWCNA
jgi:hypothetical protein